MKFLCPTCFLMLGLGSWLDAGQPLATQKAASGDYSPVTGHALAYGIHRSFSHASRR